MVEKTKQPTPLVILDVQEAIDQPVWDGKNNPDYLNSILRLQSHWRDRKWPIIYIKHDEANPASTYHNFGPWNGIKTEIAPAADDIVISKTQNCAFIGTGFDRALKDFKADGFVLVGVVIHNSMDATVRAGKALGYKICLPMDATTAVPVTGISGRAWAAADAFDLTLGILDGEYAQVMTSDAVMARFT